jgi:hypothetical protein
MNYWTLWLPVAAGAISLYSCARYYAAQQRVVAVRRQRR